MSINMMEEWRKTWTEKVNKRMQEEMVMNEVKKKKDTRKIIRAIRKGWQWGNAIADKIAEEAWNIEICNNHKEIEDDGTRMIKELTELIWEDGTRSSNNKRTRIILREKKWENTEWSNEMKRLRQQYKSAWKIITGNCTRKIIGDWGRKMLTGRAGDQYWLTKWKISKEDIYCKWCK